MCHKKISYPLENRVRAWCIYLIIMLLHVHSAFIFFTLVIRYILVPLSLIHSNKRISSTSLHKSHP